MQEKSKTFQSFSERTDALAKELRINVSDLPEKIEVSASMFHSYRSGKYPISQKAWRKLEAAEAAAGIEIEKGFNVPRETLKKGCDAESSGDPNEPEKGSGELLEVLREIAASLKEIARKLPER